jgi:hypothetical protein
LEIVLAEIFDILSLPKIVAWHRSFEVGVLKAGNYE